MEESEYGYEVLEELVTAGYVTQVSSLSEAKKIIGADPVVSKLALITTEKDGVLKHRLILDCCVSGTNSATTKYERIILPKAWDVIRDSLVLSVQGAGKYKVFRL